MNPQVHALKIKCQQIWVIALHLCLGNLLILLHELYMVYMIIIARFQSDDCFQDHPCDIHMLYQIDLLGSTTSVRGAHISPCPLRVALLLMALQAVGAAWLVEQPISSLAWYHPRLRSILRNFTKVGLVENGKSWFKGCHHIALGSTPPKDHIFL